MIKRFIKNLTRAIAYFRLGWSNYDWDAEDATNKYLQFKLTRIRKEMLNGYTDWDATDGGQALKAISVALHILKRLNDSGSYEFINKDHFIKYGPCVRIKKEVPGTANQKYGPYFTYEETYPQIDKLLWQKAHNELMNGYFAEERMQERDRRNLYLILGKYIQRWWS